MFRRPEVESWTIAGFPLATIVGTPLSIVPITSGSTAGSNDAADWSQVPSMNRIEFGRRSERPETPDKIVTEDVRFWRSTIKGSVEFATPRTYVGVEVWLVSRGAWPAGKAANAKQARTMIRIAILFFDINLYH